LGRTRAQEHRNPVFADEASPRESPAPDPGDEKSRAAQTTQDFSTRQSNPRIVARSPRCRQACVRDHASVDDTRAQPSRLLARSPRPRRRPVAEFAVPGSRSSRRVGGPDPSTASLLSSRVTRGRFACLNHTMPKLSPVEAQLANVHLLRRLLQTIVPRAALLVTASVQQPRLPEGQHTKKDNDDHDKFEPIPGRHATPNSCFAVFRGPDSRHAERSWVLCIGCCAPIVPCALTNS